MVLPEYRHDFSEISGMPRSYSSSPSRCWPCRVIPSYSHPRVDVHIPLNPADGPRHRGYSDPRLPPSRELRRDTQREIDLAAISLTQYFGHDERRFRQTFLLT